VSGGWRGWRRVLAGCVAIAWGAAGWWGSHKPLPPGAHVASALSTVPAADVAFIADITAADAFGRPVVSQAIFNQLLEVVRGARVFVVLDYTLIGGAAVAGAPPLGAQLQDALLERRRALPALKVLLISDPANERSGGPAASAALQLLRSAGMDVVITDPRVLRDSNPLYSGLWRLAASWWDMPAGALRGATQRFNFKHDHRKVIIADDGHGALTGIVGSANPQDAQALWSNVALRLTGEPLEALLASELALARASGWRGDAASFATTPPAPLPAAIASAPSARLQTLTEGAISEALLARLDAAGHGDAIDIAAFKLADRSVIRALLAAAGRGVSVRLLLDPGEDEQVTSGGIPNQPMASELESRSDGAVRVRWYRTHGERFHSNLVMVYGQERLWCMVGSANLTRRSLGDYNLEADVAVEVARSAPLAAQLTDYFDTLWSNRAALGIEYSSDFAVFANPSQADYWLSRVMEATGLSTF
jgi:phosphatidylserine/phosphatidylglycerophosphate/cardiolipin synthase-like enzyme